MIPAAESKYTMNARVMVAMANGAAYNRGFIPPECRVVLVAHSGLESKEPLVPCQLAKFQRTPGHRMEVFVAVGGYKVVCANLMGGCHQFTVPDNVPGG